MSTTDYEECPRCGELVAFDDLDSVYWVCYDCMDIAAGADEYSFAPPLDSPYVDEEQQLRMMR